MKTISVKQPWATLICSGIKDIENRTWKCPEKYIGQRVLIHASGAKMNSLFNNLTKEQLEVTHIKLGYEYDFDKTFVKSAIIGSVEIVDCVINHPSIWAEKTGETRVWANGTELFIPDKPIYNWVLANPILFDKPILNVKGKLRFWDYELSDKHETILK